MIHRPGSEHDLNTTPLLKQACPRFLHTCMHDYIHVSCAFPVLHFSVLILLRPGFIKALAMMLRVEEDGLAVLGPPCSTWVWVNRATSKRSRELPDGDESVPSVKMANRPLGNMIYIILITF